MYSLFVEGSDSPFPEIWYSLADVCSVALNLFMFQKYLQILCSHNIGILMEEGNIKLGAFI